MGIVLAVVGGIVVLLLVSVMVMYNRLVTQRNQVRESWRQIDVELQRRYDLIPNLIETVKGYAAHERGVLAAVTEARANAQRVQATGGGPTPAQQAVAEGALSAALSRLLVTVEAYPDLKANQNMMQLSEELTSTENRVAFARQAYNDAVMSYNNKREVFPAALFAGALGFTAAAPLEAATAEVREAPRVEFGVS